ncbi:MAG: hypothetical protein ACOH2N_00305 [Devosia sp.]
MEMLMADRKRAEMRRSTAAELSAIKKAPALVSLLAKLKVLASLDTEMQLPMVAMLVIVAQRPGVYQRDMDGLVGVSQSSVSRNVHNLSRYRRDGSPGFGLVEQRPDPKDVRSQRLFLTVAGVAFLARLVDHGAAIDRPKQASVVAGDAFAGVHWEVWAD